MTADPAFLNQRLQDMEKLFDAKLTGVQQQVTTSFQSIDTTLQGLTGTMTTFIQEYGKLSEKFVTKEDHNKEIERLNEEIHELKQNEIRPLKKTVGTLQKWVWGASGITGFVSIIATLIVESHFWK